MQRSGHYGAGRTHAYEVHAARFATESRREGGVVPGKGKIRRGCAEREYHGRLVGKPWITCAQLPEVRLGYTHETGRRPESGLLQMLGLPVRKAVFPTAGWGRCAGAFVIVGAPRILHIDNKGGAEFLFPSRAKRESKGLRRGKKHQVETLQAQQFCA